MSKGKIKLICLIVAMIIGIIFLSILFDLKSLFVYLAIWFALGIATS